MFITGLEMEEKIISETVTRIYLKKIQNNYQYRDKYVHFTTVNTSFDNMSKLFHKILKKKRPTIFTWGGVLRRIE